MHGLCRRPGMPVHGGAAAAASGHLALDLRVQHRSDQDSKLISRMSAAIRVDAVAAGEGRMGESTRPSLEMLESGRRPLVARGCDGRRP